MYSISQVGKMMGFTPATLRYYESEGLLPFVKRKENGIRYFEEKDLDLLATIRFMKDTGASLGDIRNVIQLVMQGDETLQERLSYYLDQEQKIKDKIQQLSTDLKKVAWKIEYYQKAIEAGTEEVNQGEAGLYDLFYKDFDVDIEKKAN
ncbi:MerR family transcriptional regulator [Enterococcus rivorum]|uniref:HTH merR-type domain-containing protein n=1 Tax=Enterococcus rivorum TaxID=762845 RepID=A0A1E5KWA2_9ENTE|nr:MerR family transcriptional regulator [Enterococcus rivorum]MBP2098307.1 DNA-binding transcriptional MerR regulator [Enterococcus rivorum]OEH81899.1 hypothetical protein BCR26_03870 [Enterococcus rivorum]